jgi:hypothetical protein
MLKLAGVVVVINRAIHDPKLYLRNSLEHLRALHALRARRVSALLTTRMGLILSVLSTLPQILQFATYQLMTCHPLGGVVMSGRLQTQILFVMVVESKILFLDSLMALVTLLGFVLTPSAKSSVPTTLKDTFPWLLRIAVCRKLFVLLTIHLLP